MASDEAALFSREAVLAGDSARRATTLLFAIESRTAQLLAGRRRPSRSSSASTPRGEREQAFLEALAQGRDAADPAHDPGSRALRPRVGRPGAGRRRACGPASRISSARSTSSLPWQVPQLRSALGLDTDAVRQAYERLYGTPLATIYAPRVRLPDRLRWAASRLAGRLDALPAFWLAFFVTLIIGAVNLALPIAVAGVGALPGIALIVVLGIINMVTVAAMVEVVTRSGSIRYGNAFIGTVVADYLGNAGSAILSAVLTAFSFGLLLIFYIGISTTLADATPLPAAAWMIVLFLVGLYFLTRGSLNATVASTIVITTINVGLLVVLSALALPHVRLENLTYVNLPWSPGGSFSPILLGALDRGRPRHLRSAHPGRHLRQDAAPARPQRALGGPRPRRGNRLRDAAQHRLGAGHLRRRRARGAGQSERARCWFPWQPRSAPRSECWARSSSSSAWAWA